MPSINDFERYSQKYVKDVLQAGLEAIKKSSDSGAEYMRELIEDKSPTGTPWHKRINAERGQPDGARKESELMLNSVDSTKVASSRTKMSSNFGWVKNKKQYFLMQDTGGYWHTAYGKPSGVGMGLLNLAQDGGGKSTLRVLGAYNHATNYFVTEMKKAGFSAPSGGQELF